MSLDSLFAAWTYAVCRFGVPHDDKNADQNDQAHQLFREVEEHYSGDSSLFEVGCYVYFRTDLWLYSNRPLYREEVSQSFVSQFTDIFSQALPRTDVAGLFSERVGNYGKLARERKEVKDFHFHLSELMKYTRDNTPPQSWSFDSGPLLLDGFFLDSAIKMQLMVYEQSWMPTVVDIMNGFFEYIEESNQPEN